MMFFTYKKVDGKQLYMKNSLTFKVLGFGKIILKMTFDKLLSLNNVLHVADIRNNLVSRLLLSKNSFKIVLRMINLYYLK